MISVVGGGVVFVIEHARYIRLHGSVISTLTLHSLSHLRLPVGAGVRAGGVMRAGAEDEERVLRNTGAGAEDEESCTE